MYIIHLPATVGGGVASSPVVADCVGVTAGSCVGDDVDVSVYCIVILYTASMYTYIKYVINVYIIDLPATVGGGVGVVDSSAPSIGDAVIIHSVGIEITRACRRRITPTWT